MHFSLLASLTLTLTALTTAQSTFENSTTVASAPFNLILHSHNRTLNGTYLSACHEGAAIGALCALPKTSAPPTLNQQFKLNYTSNICGFDNGTLFPCSYPGDPNTGILTWDLHFGGAGTGSESMVVSQSVELVNQGASSNMAFATIFFPSSGFHSTYLSFDASGKMGLTDGLDKRHPAASPNNGPQKTYYRWYVCLDYWMYYQWNHLVWVYGDGKPWDGDCQEVDVTRVFV